MDILGAEQRIAELQAQIEAEKARLSKMGPDQKNAELLHEVECRHNHTDMCGYEHEQWDKMPFNGTKHGYLKRAQAVSGACKQYGMEFEDALRIFRMIRGF